MIAHEPTNSDHFQFQATDVRFGQNRRVNTGGSGYSEQVEPTLTILSNGCILIGWKEAATSTGPGLRVGFAYSEDDGYSFSNNTLMATLGGGSQSDPWLVKDQNDNAYFTFLEYGGSSEGMGVAKTIDGGLTWQPPTQASDTPGELDDKETMCVDSNGNLYLVWDFIYYSGGAAFLKFTRSTNSGASFDPTTTLGLWEERGGIPYITCSANNTLYMTTYDSSEAYPDMIYLSKSIDLGNTWTTPANVNTWGYPSIALITVCATDSNNDVYICFAAGSITDYEVYVTKSIDGGFSWSTPVQINDKSTNMQRMVEMHIDPEDNIHVAWLDGSLGEWNIFYSYSTDGGATFSNDIKITSEGTPFSYTRPGDYFTLRSGPNGRLYIVWTDGRGQDQDIYFAKQDLLAPQINHTPPVFILIQTPFNVEVQASDDDAIERVEFHYRIGDIGTWNTQLLTRISSTSYQGEIDADRMIGSTIAYYFTVNDYAQRQTFLPASGYFIIPLLPVSPTMIIIIVASIIIITIVVIFAIWYLRRP
ncbi:MAG: sialidase family protein [Promethearchaeota archaeon]